MSSLVLGTSAVSMDEPCYSLKEIIAQSPGSRGFRRYQCIRVVRNDKIAEMRRDLGPARKFAIDEFVIPGGVVDANGRIEILHTVGELYDIAESLHSSVYDRPEAPKPADLVQGYYDSFDKKRLRKAKRSMFGETVRVQRS